MEINPAMPDFFQDMIFRTKKLVILIIKFLLWQKYRYTVKSN